MTTAILTDERYLAHNDPRHVERADRLRAINHTLDTTGLRERLLELTARPATDAEMQAVHTREHLQTVQHFGTYSGGYLDADTYMNSDSWEAAVWAAGGAARTVEAVLKGECDNAFALVRPPGHHATPTRPMGFCLINNIAVAARHAINNLGVERVAIVDFDVHHGNGTQDVFYADPQVLFCSTHASPFYPGTGLLDETGSGSAVGTTLNVPLPLGVGDKGYTQTFQEIMLPALRHWQPQLLLVSAGYDSHWSDPLGPMVLSITGFVQLTQMLYDVAAEVCDGRLMLVLEGGYNLEALSEGVAACIQVLLGTPPDSDPLGTITAPEPDLDRLITRLKTQHPLFQAK